MLCLACLAKQSKAKHVSHVKRRARLTCYMYRGRGVSKAKQSKAKQKQSKAKLSKADFLSLLCRLYVDYMARNVKQTKAVILFVFVHGLEALYGASCPQKGAASSSSEEHVHVCESPRLDSTDVASGLCGDLQQAIQHCRFSPLTWFQWLQNRIGSP